MGSHAHSDDASLYKMSVTVSLYKRSVTVSLCAASAGLHSGRRDSKKGRGGPGWGGHAHSDNLCHCVTMSLHHGVTVSLCHCVTMSLHHGVTVSLCHCVTVCCLCRASQRTPSPHSKKKWTWMGWARTFVGRSLLGATSLEDALQVRRVCHCVTLSLCHCVTVSLCQFVPVSLCASPGSMCTSIVQSLLEETTQNTPCRCKSSLCFVSLCHCVTMAALQRVTLPNLATGHHYMLADFNSRAILSVETASRGRHSCVTVRQPAGVPCH